MASRHYNLAGMTVSGAPGTGTITLGSAITTPKKLLSFASAGVPTGAEVVYLATDGAEQELSYGTYTATGTTLSRGTLIKSTTGARLSLSASAEIRIVGAVEGICEMDDRVFAGYRAMPFYNTSGVLRAAFFQNVADGTSDGGVEFYDNSGVDLGEYFAWGRGFMTVSGGAAGSADFIMNRLSGSFAVGLKAQDASVFKGAVEYDFTNHRWTERTNNASQALVMQGWLFKNLSANTNVTNSNAVQPWFPSGGAVAVEASTTYEFEGELYLGTSAASTTHTLSISFGGTATLTNIRWDAWGFTQTAEGGTGTATSLITAITGNTDVVVMATGTQMRKSVFVKGTVRINAAGTFIPQFKFSAAPNQTPQALFGTRFRLRKIGATGTLSHGTWT